MKFRYEKIPQWIFTRLWNNYTRWIWRRKNEEFIIFNKSSTLHSILFSTLLKGLEVLIFHNENFSWVMIDLVTLIQRFTYQLQCNP